MKPGTLRATIAVFLLTGVAATAQTRQAVLVGRVLDPSRGAVPQAKLTVRNVEMNQKVTTVTDAVGDFTVPNLLPGEYEVTVDKDGFKRLVESGITLQVDQIARLELRLRLGSVATTVEVQASVPVVTTENDAQGDVVNEQEIENMPLSGRNFGTLAYLVPGVLPKVQGAPDGSAFAINGARMDNTNFVIDGFNNQRQNDGSSQVSPPLDSMQEMKVETTGYSAEFGRLAGGVISMVLKTGGNRFHGALFEFNTNDAYDARNYFSLVAKPKTNRNQFGASLNGPVYIPKIYNGKNKTFFVFTWDATRAVSGVGGYSTVPTALERVGNYAGFNSLANGAPVLLADPLATGSCKTAGSSGCFPGNIIPASRISPIALSIEQYYPLPNISVRSGYNYYAYADNRNRLNNFMFKIDEMLTDKDHLSFRYAPSNSYAHNPFDGSNLYMGGSTVDHDRLYGLSYTHVFTPSLINEARMGFTRSMPGDYSDFGGQDISAQFGLELASSSSRSLGFPLIQPGDVTGLGDSKYDPTLSVANVFQFADTFTYSNGRHLVKAGIDAIRSQFYNPYNLRVTGSYTFKGSWTSSGFADMLLGLPSSTQRQLDGVATNYMFTTTLGAFVQDNWKIRPNLTLDLGLRYELMVPPYEKYGRLADFDPALGKEIIASDEMVPNLAASLALAGLAGQVGLAKDYGLPKTLANTNDLNFAPRVGLAWRPFGGTRTVIRAGYGVYYGNSATTEVRTDMGNAFPFVYPQSFSRVSSNPNALTLANPFPANLAAVTASTNTAGYQPNAPAQYNQSWNFTIQRQIGNSAIEVAYIGSKGTHLGRRFNLNQPYYAPQYKLANGSFLTPYPFWDTIEYYSFGAGSSYHSLNLTYRRRFANRFFYRFNYVWSKSLDEGSELASASSNGYGDAMDARNLSLEKGRSDFDRRHVFTMSFMYETQFQRWKWALKGWQVAATGEMYSGVGLTPYECCDSLDLGQADRPDRIASGNLPNPSLSEWFNLAAFPAVPAGSWRYGTSGRNLIDGPGQISQNLSLMRKFYVRETNYLQFRFEAFNFLNHANFNLPNIEMGAAGAGTITSAAAPRAIQLALRLVF